jgi:hypothetical protein
LEFVLILQLSDATKRNYQENDQNLKIFSRIKFGNSVVWDYEYVVAIIVSSLNVNEEEFRQKNVIRRIWGFGYARFSLQWMQSSEHIG